MRGRQVRRYIIRAGFLWGVGAVRSRLLSSQSDRLFYVSLTWSIKVAERDSVSREMSGPKPRPREAPSGHGRTTLSTSGSSTSTVTD